jgi:hypothetical protein
MKNNSPRRNAELLFDYLCMRDPFAGNADIIIGFGHFDEKIPIRCAQLFLAGKSKKILFTGGRGSGTSDLPASEASFFLEVVKNHYPGVHRNVVVIEEKSTNTAENLLFSERALRDLAIPLVFGKNLNRALIVANAYRQKRVWLTCAHIFPGVEFVNSPPETTYENERALFDRKGLDYVQCLTGEIERIVQYGKRGYIARVIIPDPVSRAYFLLTGKSEL